MRTGDHDAAATPPRLPKGWTAVPAPRRPEDDVTALRIRVRRRPRPRAVALAVTAVALWACAVVLALDPHLPGNRSWAWLVSVLGACGIVMVLTRRRTVPVWQVSPGLLLVGRVQAGDGSWREEPQRVVALRLHPDDDDGEHRVLSARLPSGGRLPLHEGSAADTLLVEIGTWLAERAGIPFDDDTAGGP